MREVSPFSLLALSRSDERLCTPRGTKVLSTPLFGEEQLTIPMRIRHRKNIKTTWKPEKARVQGGVTRASDSETSQNEPPIGNSLP